MQGSLYVAKIHERIYKHLMVVACKNEYSSLFAIALVEQLLVALALDQGRLKVGNAPSFNDLQEVPTYVPSAVKCFSQINNLCDSILSFKDISHCQYFRIMLIRSWFHFLLNSLFASENLKILIPLSFLEILQPGIAVFVRNF